MDANNGKRNSKRIWRQSPDGRVVAVGMDADADGHSSPSLESIDPDDPRLAELEPFLQGCMSVLPKRLEQGQIRLGAFLFLLGAVDRFWTLRGLDDRYFQPFAESLLRRFALSPPRAATLVAALPQVSREPFANRALKQGGDTLEDWLHSRDPNVALRLTELIAEWGRG
jgi:hypothetical protein